MKTTEQVLNHHLTSLGGEDIDAVLEDYTDRSIIVTPGGQARGLEQIRKLFEGLIATVPKAQYTLNSSTIVDQVVLLEWSAASEKTHISNGVDTFVIVSGKIMYQTARFDVRQG